MDMSSLNNPKSVLQAAIFDESSYTLLCNIAYILYIGVSDRYFPKDSAIDVGDGCCRHDM